MTSFQRDGKPPKQEEETPEEKARQKEKEEWRIEGEAQEKREKDARDKEAERKREEERERFNRLSQRAALINEKFKTNFDFKTFYDIIININNLIKDIIFKENKDDEDLKEVISYVLIGNNGEVIKEDTSFKLLLKKTFTFLSKIEGISITGNGIEGNGIEGNGIEGNGIEGNGIEGNGIEGVQDLDDTLKDSGLSTINLGILKRYDYITINDGNGEVSGIKYTINDNENKLKNDNTLAIIPILFGIIVAFYINNKGKSENEKIYKITLTKKEQVAQQGGKNKKNKKPTKPTITGKKDILGKQRCIYKKAGDRKEYVKYKGDLITVKDYKKIISVKKTKK
jgi:hypothetical protein